MEFKKGDVCSLEVVVDEVPNENGICQVVYVGDAGEGWCAYPNVKDLTLIRRAPVDLATCELPVGVRDAITVGCHGTMVGRVQKDGVLWAFVDWENGTPDACHLTSIRPIDAPAPESEVERLREVATDALNSALSGVPGWKDEAKAALKNLASTAPSFNPLRDALPKKELDRVERTMTGKPVCGMREAIAKHHATPSDAPTCPPGHIMIGDRAVPEPMREVPADGKTIYLVSTGSPALISSWRWYGNDGDKERLRSGLIHSTEANARAHAEAIIALSAGEADHV